MKLAGTTSPRGLLRNRFESKTWGLWKGSDEGTEFEQLLSGMSLLG